MCFSVNKYSTFIWFMVLSFPMSGIIRRLQGLKISVLGTDFRTGRIPKGLFIGSMQIWKKKERKVKRGCDVMT